MNSFCVASAADRRSVVAVASPRPAKVFITACTLSTLPALLSRLRDEQDRPGGAGAGLTPRAVPGGTVRTTRPDPAQVFELPGVPQAAWSRPAVDAGPLAGGGLDEMEYEARGLLNLLGFVARCLDDGGCGPDEKVRWGEELCRAKARLEALHEAGLPRDFLTNPAWRAAAAAGASGD